MRARGRVVPEPMTEPELRDALGAELESHLARAGIRDRALLDRILHAVDANQERRDRARRTRAAVRAMHELVSIFADVAQGDYDADLDTVLRVFRSNGWIDVEIYASLDRITDRSVEYAGGPVPFAAWLVTQVTGVPVSTLNDHRDYRRPAVAEVVDTLRPDDDAVDVFAFEDHA